MLLAAALFLYSLPAFAWGGLGHEAVSELAFRELDDSARQRVIALIRQDGEFTTFRASCDWADKPRQRASEHFVNLPRGATGLGWDKCPVAEDCVVRAIEDDFAVLASSDTAEPGEWRGQWVPPRARMILRRHSRSRPDPGMVCSQPTAQPAGECDAPLLRGE